MRSKLPLNYSQSEKCRSAISSTSSRSSNWEIDFRVFSVLINEKALIPIRRKTIRTRCQTPGTIFCQKSPIFQFLFLFKKKKKEKGVARYSSVWHAPVVSLYFPRHTLVAPSHTVSYLVYLEQLTAWLFTLPFFCSLSSWVIVNKVLLCSCVLFELPSKYFDLSTLS